MTRRGATARLSRVFITFVLLVPAALAAALALGKLGAVDAIYPALCALQLAAVARASASMGVLLPVMLAGGLAWWPRR